MFGSNVTEKVGNQKYFNFPLHQTSASALPGETGNLENASFMLLAFYQKHVKHTKMVGVIFRP